MVPVNSIRDFFSILDDVEYVVLRNYEYLLSPNEANRIHPDIDILCANREKILCKGITASRGYANDKVHQYFEINNTRIDLDIRQIGDGYYCEKWERDMLSHKKIFSETFYVLDDKDYFYSLLYHVLVQKKTISEDYKSKLVCMGNNYGLEEWDITYAAKLLNNFLRHQGYHFSYPDSVYTTFITKYAEQDIIENSIKKSIIRTLHRMMIKIKSGLK